MKLKPKFKDVLAFLYGLGSLTQIRIVGAMGITELVCVLCFPFVIVKIWPRMRQTMAKPMLILLGFWLLSGFFTDFWFRPTMTFDALRGCTAILFIGAMLVCSFALFWDNLLRLRWFTFGAFLSSVIAIFIFQQRGLADVAEAYGLAVEEFLDFKKYFAMVYGQGLLFLAAFMFFRMPMLVIMAQFGIGILYLASGSRSAFLITTVSGIASYTAWYAVALFRSVQKNIAMTVVVSACILAVIMRVYGLAAESGWMGEGEQKKYEAQTRNPMGLISGRSEFIAALAAIKDSPILGHGSWARDHNLYRLRIYEKLGAEEYAERYMNSSRRARGVDYIPCHSHIWQAWVWHGFAGGVFWMTVLVWLVRYIRFGVHLCRPLIAYNLIISLSFTWAILFSPIQNRPGIGAMLTTVAVTLAEVDRRRRAVQNGAPVFVNGPWDGRWHEEGERLDLAFSAKQASATRSARKTRS